MKTTLEIPDRLFRKAKSVAAERGIAFRELVTEALRDKLSPTSADSKPCMKHVGALRHLREETRRIQRRIDEEFERIDPEEWD